MSKRLLLALFAAVGFSTVGCAATTDDLEVDGDSIVAASEEGLATTGPTYKAGTDLVTTAPLNLRSGPSTSHKVLRVIPDGARVEVRKESGANAWVAVTFNGYKGWAHTSYLKKPSSGGGSGGSPSGYNATRAKKLASTADRVDGRSSGGLCALEVSNSVEKSGIVPAGRWRRNHAILISENMASDKSYTKSVGFKRIDVSANKIPKGSIIGWRRGQCGYHSTYGHIEVSIDSSSSRACSDYCGSIKKTCGKPYVFMPTSL